MILVNEPLSKFLQRMVTLYKVSKLEPECRTGYDLYQVDFSDWKLSFSDRTPLIHVPFREARHLTTSELVESLLDIAREHGWRSRECLVLLDFKRREIKSQLVSQCFPRLVIIDEI